MKHASLQTRHLPHAFTFCKESITKERDGVKCHLTKSNDIFLSIPVIFGERRISTSDATERRGWVTGIHSSYLGVPGIDSVLGDRLTCLMCFAVLLNALGGNNMQPLEVGRINFLPHPSQFVIHDQLAVGRCVLYMPIYLQRRH
jgi:hypothetical protein